MVSSHVPVRDSQNVSLRARVGKGSFRVLHSHMYRLADVLQTHVAHQGSRQETGFTEDLEAIADSKHESATGGKLSHRIHHRRKLRNRSGPKIIPVGKSSGNNDGITVFQFVRLMPQKSDWLPGHLL